MADKVSYGTWHFENKPKQMRDITSARYLINAYDVDYRTRGTKTQAKHTNPLLVSRSLLSE